MADDKIEEGDKVSWNWNGSHPDGKVTEVKEGEVSVTSHRGNEAKKTGDAEDPAVHVARSGNDVVKNASELDVEEKADGGEESEEKKGDDKPEENGEKEAEEDKEGPKVGDKRKADEKVDGDAGDEKAGEQNGDAEEKDAAADAKKQKTANGAAKKPGRPRKSETADADKKTPAKERKEPVRGLSQRKTRSQGSV